MANFSSLWHCRLGYENFYYVKTILKLCNIHILNTNTLEFYESCGLGKSHRLYAYLSSNVYNNSLDLIYTNFWDPLISLLILASITTQPLQIPTLDIHGYIFSNRNLKLCMPLNFFLLLSKLNLIILAHLYQYLTTFTLASRGHTPPHHPNQFNYRT